MSINAQVFTDAGKAMVGAANAGGLLTITKIVVGSGSAAVDTDLYPLVALIAWQADVAIIRKTDLGGGKIIVSGPLVEANMPAGAAFALKELGVMAKIDSGPEQLYSVSNAYANPPDTVTPGGTATHAFDIIIQVDRAANVTITLDDPNTVDVQNIPPDATVGPGLYAQRFGNIFQFKRLVAGPNIQLTEASDRITIATKVVTTNLNLYVPSSHPSCPSPDVGFDTIQLALNYLAPLAIPTDKTVTIHVYKGTFTSAAQITFAHPNSSQIFIQGEPRVDHAITVINNVDATHKNVGLTGSLTDLAVGMRVYIANSIAGWSGGAKITAIAGAVVTLSVEKRDTQPNFTTSDPGAGRRLSYFPTVLINTSSGYGFYCPNGIGNITNLTMDGGAQSCIAILGTNFVSNVALWNTIRGISGETVVLGGENVITQCDFGVVMSNRLTAETQNYFNACTVGIACGAITAAGSQIAGQDTTVLYLAHCQHGIRAQGGQYFIGGSLHASSNDVIVYMDLNSVASIGAGGYMNTLDNNGLGLFALGRSYIQYAKNGGAAPTTNPAVDVVGNNGSLIHVS